jgi:hypothetical protein
MWRHIQLKEEKIAQENVKVKQGETGSHCWDYTM